jgi:hypothetical protein
VTSITLIVLARAFHIISSVVWAGFVIVVAAAIVSTPRGESPVEARRIRRSAVSRGTRIVAPAAAASLVSGLYLFHALHTGAHSLTEAALGIGASTAVASFFVGAIGSNAQADYSQLD